VEHYDALVGRPDLSVHGEISETYCIVRVRENFAITKIHGGRNVNFGLRVKNDGRSGKCY
jgi:hypothetical protein